jgi:hypothetical protein
MRRAAVALYSHAIVSIMIACINRAIRTQTDRLSREQRVHLGLRHDPAEPASV